MRLLDREKKVVKETKISELLLQRLNTEPNPITMKYSREEPRDLFRLNMKR